MERRLLNRLAMKLSLPCFAGALAAVGTCAGCNYAVFSPPARPMPLESAATLPKGDTGVQVQGATAGTIFGPSVLSGSVRVRHGVADDVDLDVEASLVRVEPGREPAASISQSIQTAAVGAKVQIVRGVAVAGDLGAGYSAAGAFVNPELGPIVAFENRYVVPFAGVRFGLSQPISPRQVDVTEEGDPLGTHVGTPRSTWIVGGVAGVRIPIGWAEHPAGTTRGSLLGGVGVTHLADSRDEETFAQLSFGGELVF